MRVIWKILPILMILQAWPDANAADLKGIFPPGSKPVGPYSPGIVAGDYLYVSGQGARRSDGTFPTDAAAQIDECLAKIKSITTAAGFSMEGIVYSQVYVRDVAAFPVVEQAWSQQFPKNGPARSVIGVANLPDNTPVEVNAVVIRDPSAKKALVVGPGDRSIPAIVLTPDRAYLSDCRGTGASEAATEAALDRMGLVLKAGGLDYSHMVFVNPFMLDSVGYEAMNHPYAKHFEFGNTPARATINVAALPENATIEFTGIAVRDLSQRRAVRPKNMPPSPTASPCVLAGTTLYCSAKSGFIPGPQSGVYAGTVEGQLRQTMRNLLDGLEEAGLDFDNVVAANVYLDDVQDFENMNRIYKLFFQTTPPARTTVQQHAAVTRKANEKEEWPTLEQISLVAVGEQK